MRTVSRIVGVLALVVARPAFADWAAYHSDNFVVYSDSSEAAALRTLDEFEVFRRVSLLMLNLPDVPEAETLKIFLFDRPRDFNRINGNRNAAGFFYHSVFGPRLIVGPGSREESRRILFHEYVHYLQNNRFAVNYPTWYSEGLADLLASVEIDNSSIVLGFPPDYGIWAPATVDRVIERKQDEIFQDFYQTSFFLVHYLLIESYDDPTRAQQTADYIRRFDAGEDPVEAFVASFGMSPIEMQDEMNLMNPDNRTTTIRLDRIEYEGDLTKRELVPGEDLYVLGDIAVELSRYESVYVYFDSFDELEEESPFAEKVDSRRAIAYIHEDRIEEGDETIAALVAGSPTDPDVLADISHYAYDRFVYAARNDEERVRDHLDRAIDFGKRAVQGNPEDLEALYYLGLAYESIGELQLAVNTLLESYDRNPSVPPLNLSLARVLIKGRQLELASYLISRVYSATHSAEMRARLDEVQSLIQAEDFDIASISELL